MQVAIAIYTLFKRLGEPLYIPYMFLTAPHCKNEVCMDTTPLV